jgi:hypothetical protein
MHRIIALAAMALGLVVSTAPVARADIIIGNLPENDGDVTFLGGSGASKGMGFTMTGSYLLTSVTLRLDASAGTATVRLLDSVGGLPTNTLLTFNRPSFGSGAQSYVFTPSHTFSLVNGTTYWLVLTDDTGFVTWSNAITGHGDPDGRRPSQLPRLHYVCAF